MFGIRKAIGLGLTIVVLKLLMSAVFIAVESTLLTALSAFAHAFQYADHVVGRLPQ
jgi:hypothetical protein